MGPVRKQQLRICKACKGLKQHRAAFLCATGLAFEGARETPAGGCGALWSGGSEPAKGSARCQLSWHGEGGRGGLLPQQEPQGCQQSQCMKSDAAIFVVVVVVFLLWR